MANFSVGCCLFMEYLGTKGDLIAGFLQMWRMCRSGEASRAADALWPSKDRLVDHAVGQEPIMELVKLTRACQRPLSKGVPEGRPAFV